MYKFLNSKKGFTLVELMVVIVLLSFGIVALANLFKVGYTAFEKSMERYQKQEAAKSVAVYLQSGSSALGGASKVELYDTLDVLPADGTVEKGCAYIYVDPDDGFLYCRDKGATEPVQLTDQQLYIKFDIINTGVKDPISGVELTRGINCNIAATESEYDFSSGEPPISDEIYYDLDVAYHFPNMIENGVLYVNRVVDAKLVNGQKEIAYQPAFAIAADQNKTRINTVDNDAILVKFVSDMTIDGEELLTDNNMSLYCFIATASYGVNNGEGVVGLLCDFRDKVLLTNPLGEAFVKAYYKYSPPVADVIAESEPLKAAVRVALKPLVVIAVNALNEDVAKESAPWFAVFMLCSVGATATLVKVNKRKKIKE